MTLRSHLLGMPLIAMLLVPVSGAFSQEGGYASMEGVGPVHAVFDFRVGDPGVATSHLSLIHSMLDDPNMSREGEDPEVAVVFIGPAVNLLSTDDDAPEGATAVADVISEMEADGVTFEICMTSAHALGVSAESILPEVTQVGNGWISLIGYQQSGFSTISNF